MIQHYGEKEINTSGHFSWERSEASYRRKAFEDMKMVYELYKDKSEQDRKQVNRETLEQHGIENADPMAPPPIIKIFFIYF